MISVKTSQTAMFGHDFGPRPLNRSFHAFTRIYAPGVNDIKPQTYQADGEIVAVRVFSGLRANGMELFRIGTSGVQQLKDLEIAEIAVTGIGSEYAQRALDMLANNYKLLMSARPGRNISDVSGIGGFLSTDHMECAGFSQSTASFFSDRLDGQRGLLITQYAFDIEHKTHKLMLSDKKVQNLFAKLGLKLPESVCRPQTVAQLDLLRIFDDGAAYTDMIHIPFEFLTAEPAPVQK